MSKIESRNYVIAGEQIVVVGDKDVLDMFEKETAIRDVLFPIEKSAPPVLKTEDGFEMEDSEIIYKVFHDFSYTSFPYYKKGFKPIDGCQYFKVKENAMKFIADNKPRFSKKQILESHQQTGLGNQFIVIDRIKLGI